MLSRALSGTDPAQYALWPRDWYMWEMLVEHMDDQEAADQYQALEDNGAEYRYANDKISIITKAYDLQPLITALQTYIDSFDSWKWDQRDHHWCSEIGGAQRTLPAHVIMEYIRVDRLYYPCPDFRVMQDFPQQAMRFVREKKWGLEGDLGKNAAWAGLASASSIVSYFGDGLINVSARPMKWGEPSGLHQTEEDAGRVRRLSCTRTEQFTELGEVLKTRLSLKK